MHTFKKNTDTGIPQLKIDYYGFEVTQIIPVRVNELFEKRTTTYEMHVLHNKIDHRLRGFGARGA